MCDNRSKSLGDNFLENNSTLLHKTRKNYSKKNIINIHFIIDMGNKNK